MTITKLDLLKKRRKKNTKPETTPSPETIAEPKTTPETTDQHEYIQETITEPKILGS